MERLQESLEQRYENREPDELADYIVNTHHKYVNQALPEINGLCHNLARLQGDAYPELIEIAGLFNKVTAELKSHMLDEENTLFPYIKQLAQVRRENRHLGRPPFGSIVNPIKAMETEHFETAKNVQLIYENSNQYTPPKGAGSDFKILYNKLDEFEKDLKEHIHLENNVLFPKAMELESEMWRTH
jgi:regulator of cell morphogenesis and NO signaling